jgi:hypothetical protein
MIKASSIARLATVLALCCGAALAAPSEAGVGCAQVHQRGAWQTIEIPQGDVYPDPARENGLFVVGGSKLQQSTDGGCSWQIRFDAGDVASRTGQAAPYGVYPNYQIAQIVLPNTGEQPGRQHIYLLLHDRPGNSIAPAIPPAIATSTDGGRSWTLRAPSFTDASGGQPTCGGQGPKLLVAPSALNVMYLLCPRVAITSGVENKVNEETGQQLWNEIVWYASRDGGATWARGNSVGNGYISPNTPFSYTLAGIAVDPQDPLSVWALLSQGVNGTIHAGILLHSTDGARTFREAARLPYPGDPQALGLVISRPRKARSANIVVWAHINTTPPSTATGPAGPSSGFGRVAASLDGGKTWKIFDTPQPNANVYRLDGVVPSAASTPTRLFVLAADGRQKSCGASPAPRSFVLDIARGTWEMREAPIATPDGAIGGMTQLRSGGLGKPTILARAGVTPQSCTAEESTTAPPKTSTTLLLRYMGRL